MRNVKDWLDTSIAGQAICAVVIIGVAALAPPFAMLLWLLWRWQLKKKFSEFGLIKPGNLPLVIIKGILIGIGLKLVFKAIIMPILGAEPTNSTFDHLVGNLSASLSFAFFAMVSAGLGEEILFRGFLFTRMKLWLGDSTNARTIIIISSSLIFGIPHIYQGFYGAVHAVLVGSVFGLMYFHNKGNLWLLIVAHAFYDLFAILLIYKGWDEAIGTLLFH